LIKITAIQTFVGYAVPDAYDVTDVGGSVMTLENFMKNVNDVDDVAVTVTDANGNVQWWQGSLGGFGMMGRMAAGYAGKQIGKYAMGKAGQYAGQRMGARIGPNAAAYGKTMGRMAGQAAGAYAGQQAGQYAYNKYYGNQG